MSYKTAIVNFEAFFIPKEDRCNVIMKDIEKAVDAGCDTILGLMLADGFLFFDYDYVVLLNELRDRSKALGVKKLVLVPGICPDMVIPGYEVFKKFNYNLHLAYLSYKDKQHLLQPWNSKSDKFLFLGGVPDRPNRINLMEKFYRSGLLRTNAVWSFFRPWTPEQKEWCRKALPDYTDVRYADFLDYCEKSIDDLYITSKEYGTSKGDFDYKNCEWFKDPAWMDPSIYANTLFSVVSEGISYEGYSSQFLTEKTWRVFAQRHPFILAANDEMMDYAKSLGFRLFNESNDLDDIVEDVRKFLKERKDYTEDIEHNYNLFFKLGAENAALLDSIKEEYNVTQEEIDKWFNKTGFSHLIRKVDD